MGRGRVIPPAPWITVGGHQGAGGDPWWSKPPEILLVALWGGGLPVLAALPDGVGVVGTSPGWGDRNRLRWVRGLAEEKERGTWQNVAWALLRHPRLLLAGVAGTGRGEGAVEGTGTGQRWGGGGGGAPHLQ